MHGMDADSCMSNFFIRVHPVHLRSNEKEKALPG